MLFRSSATAFAVAVGVPLITPVEEFKASPAGSVPEVSVHVYGVAPPVAVKVWEYGVPAWPPGNDVVVIVKAAEATVSVRLTFDVCAGELESVTLKVSATAFAVVVGVPLITPVEEFNASPVGSVPEVSVHAYGAAPPLAVIVCEYAFPTCPFARKVVEMLTGVSAPVTVMLSAFVAVRAVGAVESVTNKVKLKVPEAAGIPEIAPIGPAKLRPGGITPELMLHV